MEYADGKSRYLLVSPELTLRPSLSGECRALAERAVQVSPELTLRPSLSAELPTGQDGMTSVEVSPELTLRPSLSAILRTQKNWLAGVSPELTLRPSLSVLPDRARHEQAPRVAGANAPAFVERDARRQSPRALRSRVAGANAPAFVERSLRAAAWFPPLRVSPELTLRPSLSAGHRGEADNECSSVAGANAPAFVERPWRPPAHPPAFRCRRS